jgi:hypothetical protein
MGITRRVVPLAAIISLLVATPASAATTFVTSTKGVPSSYYIQAYNFCDKIPVASTYRHVTGPATPPRGVGSLRLVAGVHEEIEFGRDRTGNAGSITAFQLSAFVPTTPSSHVLLGAWAYEGSTIYQADITLAHAGAWTQYDLLDGRMLNTRVVNSEGQAIDTGQQSWATWANAHSTATSIIPYIGIDTCAGTQAASVYVDKVRILQGAEADTTVDIEPSPPATMTITASRSRLVAGQSVTLSTELSNAGSVIANRPVQLLARKAGTQDFHKVADVVTDDNGDARSTQKPVVNTTYRWRFTGDENTGPTTSPGKTVNVARKITLKVADATLAADQKLRARGATTPVGRGLTVKLWKQRSGADLQLAKTTTAADGTWHLRTGLTKGVYDLYVTVSATTKNLAGKSRIVAVASA